MPSSSPGEADMRRLIQEELQRSLAEFGKAARASLDEHRAIAEDLRIVLTASAAPIPTFVPPVTLVDGGRPTSTRTSVGSNAQEGRNSTEHSTVQDRQEGRNSTESDRRELGAHVFKAGDSFHDLQRQETDQSEPTRLARLKGFIQSKRFKYIMSVIISLNALCIGVEIDAGMNGKTTGWSWIEHVFLCIYVVESCLNILTYGVRVLKDGWKAYDLCLVVIGVMTSWIVLPISAASGATAQGQDNRDKPFVDLLEQVFIFRLMRLFRLGRTLRFFSQFETLAKLLLGTLSSMHTMMSAMVVIILTIYIMACVGAELITNSDLRYDPIAGPVIEDQLRTLPDFMLMLFQFCTADSISSIYLPLVQARPWLFLYFLANTIVITFLLMNLVTAVVVEDSLQRAQQDQDLRDMQMRRYLQGHKAVLHKLFDELDTSKDGQIRIKEILKSKNKVSQTVPEDLKSILTPERLTDLFEYLDNDGSGTLSREEFVEGVGHLALGDREVEATRTLCVLRDVRRMLYQDIRKVVSQTREELHKHIEYTKLQFEQENNTSASQLPRAMPSPAALVGASACISEAKATTGAQERKTLRRLAV